ncbi:MAG: hypothetical protein BWZ02_02801 [Lentisphaerae bacterium ADurb.BinA184]|nr:MAG: hypothetical protein BWZ02_02801 [Lentisphaerae bacterium ADurb.BinA184]
MPLPEAPVSDAVMRARRRSAVAAKATDNAAGSSGRKASSAPWQRVMSTSNPASAPSKRNGTACPLSRS